MEKSRSQKIADLFRPKSNKHETDTGEALSRSEKEKIKAERFAREGLSDADYSLLKIFVVIIVTALSAFLFSYALIFWSFWPAIIVAFFCASLIALIPLLLKAWILYLATTFVLTIAFVLPLFLVGNVPVVPAGVVAIITIVMLMAGFVSAKRELNNSLRISFTKFSGKVLGRAFIVISIVLAVTYGWNFQARALFSDDFINRVIVLTSPFIGQHIPGFDPQMKLSNLIDTFARQSVLQHDVGNFIHLPIHLQKQVVNQTATSLYETIENNLGTNINLETSVQDNLQVVITDKVVVPIEAIPAERLAVIIALIIFIAVSGPFWFLSWVAMGIAFILFQLLLTIKFAETYLEPRSKEIILIK